MSKKFVENVWLETETCCDCGMVFAMTTDFMRRRRQDNNIFYCPAGHGQSYTANPDFSNQTALFALRNAFGLTQSDLAKEIGVSAPYVSLFEHGKPIPKHAEKSIVGWINTHNAESA